MNFDRKSILLKRNIFQGLKVRLVKNHIEQLVKVVLCDDEAEY